MDNKLMVNTGIRDMISDDKKVVITISDTNTGKEMKSYGRVSTYQCSGDHETWRVELSFKTAENESQVKDVTVKSDGSFKINSMMRNHPVPSDYQLISIDVVGRYTEEEKKQIELMRDIHSILDKKCHEYIHFEEPVLLILPSIDEVVFVEYFTKDWFGIDDIINYRTDHIRMSRLSIEDLMLVKDMLLK